MNSNNDSTPLKTMPITQWAKADRPREKMEALGKKSLTDSELLAILLRTGIKGTSAMALAQEILKVSNNKLTTLARMEINDLQKTFKGLGLAKSVTILAALELGNRMLREESEAKENIISNSKDLFDYASESLIDLNHEEFWAIFLNQRNKVTHSQRISMGGLTQTTVDLRVIFKAALENKATALAVAHNHPSGNLKPSTPDKELTRRIAEAGNILNIKLIDHIIVGILPDGKRDYFSFSEHGLL